MSGRRRKPSNGLELVRFSVATLCAAGIAFLVAGLVAPGQPGVRPLIWWMTFASTFLAGTSRPDRS